MFGEQQRQNEQSTNSGNDIPTAFKARCSVVRRNWEYTPTLAPRCPVRQFVQRGRVVCLLKDDGQISAHSARLPAPYRHPFGQLLSPVCSLLLYSITIGKAFADFRVPVESSTSLSSKAPSLASPEQHTIIFSYYTHYICRKASS